VNPVALLSGLGIGILFGILIGIGLEAREWKRAVAASRAVLKDSVESCQRLQKHKEWIEGERKRVAAELGGILLEARREEGRDVPPMPEQAP